jgi:hypothetical protein
MLTAVGTGLFARAWWNAVKNSLHVKRLKESVVTKPVMQVTLINKFSDLSHLLREGKYVVNYQLGKDEYLKSVVQLSDDVKKEENIISKFDNDNFYQISISPSCTTLMKSLNYHIEHGSKGTEWSERYNFSSPYTGGAKENDSIFLFGQNIGKNFVVESVSDDRDTICQEKGTSRRIIPYVVGSCFFFALNTKL